MAERASLQESEGSGRQEKRSGVPLPFTEAVVSKAISELPDGAQLAVSTCLDLWRDRKFGTEEFVSFMKCYAEQSATLATVFQGENDSSAHSDSTAGNSSALTSRRGASPEEKRKRERQCNVYPAGEHPTGEVHNKPPSLQNSTLKDVGDAVKAESTSADANGTRNSSGSSPQVASLDSHPWAPLTFCCPLRHVGFWPFSKPHLAA